MVSGGRWTAPGIPPNGLSSVPALAAPDPTSASRCGDRGPRAGSGDRGRAHRSWRPSLYTLYRPPTADVTEPREEQCCAVPETTPSTQLRTPLAVDATPTGDVDDPLEVPDEPPEAPDSTDVNPPAAPLSIATAPEPLLLAAGSCETAWATVSRTCPSRFEFDSVGSLAGPPEDGAALALALASTGAFTTLTVPPLDAPVAELDGALAPEGAPAPGATATRGAPTEPGAEARASAAERAAPAGPPNEASWAELPAVCPLSS